MIQSQFVLALLINLGGEHAALHPRNADLYVELPNVQAALAAYEKAPLVQTINGQPFQELLGVAKQMGQDPSVMLTTFLPKPREGHADDRWWPWSTATRASLSFTGIRGNATTGKANSPASLGFFCVLDFPDAPAAKEAQRALTTDFHTPLVDGVELDLGTRKLATTQLSGDGDRPWLTHDESRLFIAYGASSREQLAARIADPKLGFAPRAQQAPFFTPSSGVVLLDVHADLPAFVPPFDDENAKFAGTRMAQHLMHLGGPLLSTGALIGSQGHWRTELRGDRFVTEGAYVRAGAAEELDAILGTSTVSALARSMVPKEAIGAWVTSIKPDQLESAIQLWTSEIAGLAGTATLEPLPADAPRMSAALGEALAVYTLPISPTSQTLPFVVSVELKDKELFTRAFEAWCAHQQKLHPELELKQKAYRKTMVYTLARKGGGEEDEAAPPVPGGDPMASIESLVKPALFAWNDRVVLTLSPSIARSEIKRLESKGAEKHAIADESFGARDAFEVSTMDWGSTLAKLYDLARAFVPMMLQSVEPKPDLSKLPTGAVLFQHFRPTISWSKRVDGRIYSYTESSFGPEIFAGLLGAATIVVPNVLKRLDSLGVRPDGNAQNSQSVQAPKPATDPSATSDAERDVAKQATLTALRDVRTGLAVYRNQVSRYPEKLAQLLTPTQDFPKGFLASTSVPADGWKRELVYKPASDGATYVLYSLGSDGVDQEGSGDDVKLP